MNNQSKLARQIFYCLRVGDDLVLDKVYPLYIRYVKCLGKGEADYNLLEQVNKKYADYQVKKYMYYEC